MAKRGGSETHKLILQFIAQGRATTYLSQLSKGLRASNKDAQALSKTLAKLGTLQARTPTGAKAASDTTRMTRAARESLKLQQEQLKVAREAARLDQARARATGAQRSAEAADLRYLRERKKLESASGRASARRRGEYDTVDRFNRGVRTARNVATVARAAYDTVKGGFVDPALELKRAQTRFQLMGFPQAEQAKGFQAIDQVTQQIKGVRKVDVTELMTNLTGTLGDVNQATEMLPQAAKFLAATEALNGDKVGRGEAIKAFSDATRAVELMGKDIDSKTAKQFLNLIAQTQLATGGDINPAEFRNFVKRGQISAMQMSPEGLMKFMPLVQQMGGDAAGTALTSLYSAMVGGQIPAQKLRYWQEMGLLDKSKVEFNKTTGKVQRLQPGAIPIAEGMGRDPLAVSDRLMVAFEKKGINTSDPESVAKQLEVMFGNRTAKREMAQMMVMRRQLEKETANYLRVPDIEGFYGSMFEQGNVLGKFMDFTASQTNARATAGGPVAELGGSIAEQLSNQIKALQSGSSDHPATAAALIGIYSLGKASAEAADGVGIFDSVLRGAKGGGGGEATTSLLTGGASLVGRGAYGLAGLAANPVGFTILSTLAAGYASYKNVQTYRGQLQGEKGAADTYAKLMQQRNRGEAGDYGAAARQARELLAKGGEMSRAEGIYSAKEFENTLYRKMAKPIYGAGALPMDKELLQRLAPQLAIPEVRESFFRTEAPQLGLSKTGIENLRQAVNSVFVDSLPKTGMGNLKLMDERSQGLSSMVQGLQSVYEPAKQTAEAFGMCVDPALKLAPGLRDSYTAAQDFASKVRNLQLQTPTFTFTVGPDGKITPTTDNPQPLKAPGSAIGSIINRSGIVNLHKGNVVFPASLSRRRPGDWLDDARSLQRAFMMRARDADAVYGARTVKRAGANTPRYVDSPGMARRSMLEAAGSSPVQVEGSTFHLHVHGNVTPDILPQLKRELASMIDERDQELESRINRNRDYRNERDWARS
jgi:hypothetical protein